MGPTTAVPAVPVPVASAAPTFVPVTDTRMAYDFGRQQSELAKIQDLKTRILAFTYEIEDMQAGCDARGAALSAAGCVMQNGVLMVPAPAGS